MHSQAEADLTEEVSRQILETNGSTLGELWAKLDFQTQTKIVKCIQYFINPELEKPVVEDRARRGAVVKWTISKQIKALQKTYQERMAFEESDHPLLRRIVSPEGIFWPQELGPLSAILLRK
jgi:hypothetical protein